MSCKNHPLVEDRLTRCAVCTEAFCSDCIVAIGGLPYCMDCKSEMLLDLLSGVPLLSLDLASVSRRFAALFVDGLILSLPLILIFFLTLFPVLLSGQEIEDVQGLPKYMPLLNGVLTLVWMGLIISYEGLMLSLMKGQTLGKKMLHLRVVTAEGTPISRGQAWGRALVRQVFGLVPCLGLVDYLVALGAERTCVHDILAKTRVINWYD
ncbi:MAG: RDD family protein [Acidobacteriota bacterium]